MKESLKYWVWLSSISNVSNRKKLRLLQIFGNPENIWRTPKNELLKNDSINMETAIILADQNIKKLAARNMEEIYRKGIKVIPLDDPMYPDCLKKIYDPPIVLYCKGKLVNDEVSVAVVGSRKATPYGREMAENISYELACNGVTVISGMARGIDSYAHKGALRAGGRTIAVLGCGLDTVYPKENEELMERIVQSGAVISEYTIGTPPLPANFPARNRIISGMSVGVAVIEANEKSGSLITANFALEQGKDVFAVPGNANSIYSSGTNRLIKEGARLVTDVNDILEEISSIQTNGAVFLGKYGEINSGNILKGLCGEERIIAEQLMQGRMHIDVIAERCGFSVQLVSSILVLMELKGMVEQLPGKIFELKI